MIYQCNRSNNGDTNGLTEATAGIRQMMFVVPQGAVPGQTLGVAAPDGTTVSVVLQSSHKPGDQVMINY